MASSFYKIISYKTRFTRLMFVSTFDVQCSGNPSDPIANEKEIHRSFHFAYKHNLDTVRIRIRGADDLDVSHNISQKLFLLLPPSQTCVWYLDSPLCEKKNIVAENDIRSKSFNERSIGRGQGWTI